MYLNVQFTSFTAQQKIYLSTLLEYLFKNAGGPLCLLILCSEHQHSIIYLFNDSKLLFMWIVSQRQSVDYITTLHVIHLNIKSNSNKMSEKEFRRFSY